MEYTYGEPYLEISFVDGRVVRIKKSAITDICEEKVNDKMMTKVNISRGGSSSYYRFNGRMEEFDKRCKTIII